MSEAAIRIYQPRGLIGVTSIEPVFEAKKDEKKETKFETLKWAIEKQEKKTRELQEKYPAFNVFYNYLVLAVMIALVVGFIVWGVQIHTDNKAESMFAVAMADWQSEQQAAEDARQAELAAIQTSAETIRKQNAEYKAKILYGMRRFEEKYGYSEADMLTLCQCIENRVKNSRYPNTIEAVVKQEDQWVGYSDQNPVVDKYYQIALRSEQEKETQVADPVSSDYVFAVFTERGIYLSDEFNSQHPYTWWRHA